MPYDTVGVRISRYNGSMTSGAYKTSPTKVWYNLIGNQDFLKDVSVGFVQIKNYGSYKVLFEEIFFSVKINPSILLRFDFWFFALVSIFTPRILLRNLTRFYKNKILRLTVKEIKRW
jgi:hypothetical protein